MVDEFAQGFFRMLTALRPYLPQIVIGGGWAPFLYYRFDILAGSPEIVPMVVDEFIALSGNHPAWFKKFKTNLIAQFKNPDAEGPFRVVEQRPANAFSNLDDDQLRYFAHGTLEQFIREIKL